MAVDTRNKRASILGIGLVAALLLPAPDGGITAPDREQVAFTYSGIPASGGAHATPWCASATGISGDTSVRYYPVGDTRLTTTFGAEVNVQVPYRTAGVHSHLTIVVTGNAGKTGATLVRFRINGVNGTQVISVPAGATGLFTDAVHNDPTNAGDLLDVQVDASGGTNDGGPGQSISYTVINGVFLSSKGSTVKKQLSGGIAITTAAGGTYYGLVGGQQMGVNGFESVVQTKVTQPEVYANSVIACSANSLDGPTVLTLRKNGVDTAITMTIPAGSTTLVEDTAHSATFAADDLISWKYDLSGSSSGTILFTFVAVESTTTSGAVRTYTGNGSAGASSFRVPIGGDAINAVAPTAFGVPFVAAKMQVLVVVNTAGSDAVFQWQTNGVPGNQTVTVPAGMTGIFEDTTHTDAAGPTDVVDFLVNSVSSGLCIFNSINWLGLGPAGAGPSTSASDNAPTSFDLPELGSNSPGSVLLGQPGGLT